MDVCVNCSEFIGFCVCPEECAICCGEMSGGYVDCDVCRQAVCNDCQAQAGKHANLCKNCAGVSDACAA